MTVIAYKDGVLCADRQVTDHLIAGQTTKVFGIGRHDESVSYTILGALTGSITDKDVFGLQYLPNITLTAGNILSYKDNLAGLMLDNKFEYVDTTSDDKPEGVLVVQLRKPVLTPWPLVYIFGPAGIPTLLGECREGYAIGSGYRVAMGALYAGASAIQAVGIASRLDPYCGGGIDLLHFPDCEPKPLVIDGEIKEYHLSCPFPLTDT